MEMTRQDEENFLKKIGADLKLSQMEALDNLRKRAKAEFRKTKNFIEVVTTIEPAENFSPVEDVDAIFLADNQPMPYDAPESISGKSFFLDTSYEEFLSLLNRDFQGAGFTWQFKPNYRFVEAEEKLFRIAQVYDVPVQIFSPYARRAVDICIFGKAQEQDFQFEENGLAEKILTDKQLYWNVEFGSIEDLYDRPADDMAYLLPCSPPEFDDEIRANRVDGQIIFDSPREISAEDCELIRILPTENKIAPRIFSKQRLRTQGDVEFVLSGLARDGYSCRFGKFDSDATKKIRRYSKEHRYFSSRDEKLSRAKLKLPVCSVKFSGDEKFLTDYANFVLHFLEENYPEFNWAGERDE